MLNGDYIDGTGHGDRHSKHTGKKCFHTKEIVGMGAAMSRIPSTRLTPSYSFRTSSVPKAFCSELDRV